MANYQNLKAAISAAIKTNGNQEITGQVLQDVLNSIVSVIGDNYTFAGVATPATNPGTPDQNVVYVALQAGTYTNFNGIVLTNGISLLMWDGTWTSEILLSIDDEINESSDNLVKNKAVANFVYPLKVALSTKSKQEPIATTKGSFWWMNGERANQNYQNTRYAVTGGKDYAIMTTVLYPSNIVPFVVWLTSDNTPISESYLYKGVEYVALRDWAYVKAPQNAAYCIINVTKMDTASTSLVELENVDAGEMKRLVLDNSRLTKLINQLNVEYLVATEIVTGSFIKNDGSVGNNSNFNYAVFPVEEGEAYSFSDYFGTQTGIYFVHWFTADGVYIGHEDYGYTTDTDLKITDQPVIAPPNASFLYLNRINGYYASKVKKIIADSNALIDIKKELANIYKFNELEPTVNIGWIKPDGTIDSNTNMRYSVFEITGGKRYLFSSWSYAGLSPLVFFVHWYDSENNHIGYELYQAGSQTVNIQDELVIAPTNASYAYINWNYNLVYPARLKEISDVIKSRDLEERISSIENSIGKTMKVVVLRLNRDISDTVFGNQSYTDFRASYIRTRYNEEKDIIVSNYLNGNQLISFDSTWIGSNSLTDDELMTDSNKIGSFTDSTSPLFHVDEYWHIFAQHGCPMPFFNNSGLTSDDVGAEWKDQLERHYKIGLVKDSKVYLIPVMYQDSKGHWVRDWKNTVFSPAITSLTHVSGGVHTAPIAQVSGYSQVQLRPVMINKNRKWYADGGEITEPGTYYCNELNISETAIGYDPATITDWFGAAGNNVNLSGALPMAEFTFSYNYKGAQCCVNTTIHILREIECLAYGAIQQQFFIDKGDYKAMFMIPKAASRSGVELDKPFNSPALTSTTYPILRNSVYLKDVNNPVDRQIGYLFNPIDGKYMVGLAAGLSLVSGDTIVNKRIQNCPIGNDTRNRILLFSPSDTNKFYIAAFNTAPFADNDYYLPVGFFKEVNYYVSYFDPAENVGQVYWYKDGSRYVIYCHCQSIQKALAINVPEVMEGLKLTIVEKTENTELLTDTIQNGKFFVNYNTDDANYIVVKAE